MAQMNLWNGGKSVRLNNALIQETEGIIYTNVDISKGSLAPLREDTDENTLVYPDFIWFNNQWVTINKPVDFVEFQNKLYYSDGVGIPQKSDDGVNFFNLGIEGPDVQPTTTVNTGNINDVTSTEITGEWIAGTRAKYIIVDEDTKGIFMEFTISEDSKGFELTIDIDPAYTGDIRVYRAVNDGVTYRLLNEGTDTVVQDVGDILTSETIDFYDATKQYCYTYYNTSDDTESAPSQFSEEINVIMSNDVDVDVTASTDPQVDAIRIYRLGGNVQEMQLVDEITNATQTYNDEIPDGDLTGEVLDTEGNGQAPEGLQYLTEANAMFFGAIGPRLFYSDVALVNNWNPFNFFDFDRDIVGMGVTQNGVIVCTQFKAFIVTGTDPSTLSKYPLDLDQGCLLHKSMQYLNNTLVWLSSDGICASTGGPVDVITRDKLGKLMLGNPKAAIVYDDVYYLSHDSGTLVVDARFGLIMYDLDISPDGWSIKDDVLYYSLGENLYSLGTDVEFKELFYKTGDMGDGQLTNQKKIKTINTEVIGVLYMKVFLDGVQVGAEFELGLGNTAIDRTYLPQSDTYFYNIAFEIRGKGTLRELEYIVEGETNA